MPPAAAYPFSRTQRQSTPAFGDGVTTVFGPSSFAVADVADVVVMRKDLGQARYSEVSATVAKTDANALLSTFTVTISPAMPATTQWYYKSRRLHERTTALTKATNKLDTDALDAELSRIGTIQQEHYRELGAAVKAEPGVSVPVIAETPTEGKVLIAGADAALINGPTATEIANAQARSVEAAASASNALASALASTSAQAIAVAASQASGITKFYDTYALANAALGSIANGDAVQVFFDENYNSGHTVYRKEGGVLVYKLQYPREKRISAEAFGVSSAKSAATNTTAILAAIALAVLLGIRIVDLPGSPNPIAFNQFNCPKSILLDGVASESTIVSFSPAPGGNGIVFTDDSKVQSRGGVSNCTILNAGANIGGMAISTPVATAVFDNVARYKFEGLQFRGAGWQKYLRIGDANQGSVKDIEWRGTYSAKVNDVGQDQCIALELTGAKGNVGICAENVMIVGVRTGLHCGDFSEGFFFKNSEIVSAWIGIDLDPNPSKPGGFIGDVHVNANHRCIRGARKRDLQLGEIQCYRDGSYYDHTGDWKGIELDGCGGITAGDLIMRVPNTFVNDTGMVAVDIDSTSQVTIGAIVCREQGGIDKVLKLANVNTLKLAGGTVNEQPVWVEMDTLCQNIKIGAFEAYGALPTATPYFIAPGMTGARKRTIKIDRKGSGFQFYTDHGNKSAAFTDTLYPGFSGQDHKYSVLAGAGPWAGSIELDDVSAFDGDTIAFRLTFLNSTNGTVTIKASIGGLALTVLNNTTGNTWNVIVVCKFNGSGWTLWDQHTSAA